jgi:RND family efflux transporter MFP subunit
MRIVLILILVAALGGGGFFLWKNWERNRLDDQKPRHATSAIVERKDIRFTVTVAGEIGPAEQVSVRPEINGRIDKLVVDIGDKAKKGSLLFSLDDKDLQIEIATRETEIASAKLQLEKARRDFETDEKLFREQLVSKESYENARTDYELAKKGIERAERALDLAKDRLSKTTIVAPFDCTILTRPVSAGQAVSGSGGFNSGTEVLTIANLNEMIIQAHVNQADVTRLKPDQEVDVQVEAVPGLRVKGMVERIAPQAVIKNNIKGFSARILLKDVDPRVQPGMTANISIPVASAKDVLAVPLAAVFTEQTPDMSRPEQYVYVKKDSGHERRAVQIGVADYFNAEVLNGVQEGETVSLEQPPEAAQSKVPAGLSGEKPAAPGAPRAGGASGEPARPASIAREEKTRPVSAVGSQRVTDSNANR